MQLLSKSVPLARSGLKTFEFVKIQKDKVPTDEEVTSTLDSWVNISNQHDLALIDNNAFNNYLPFVRYIKTPRVVVLPWFDESNINFYESSGNKEKFPRYTPKLFTIDNPFFASYSKITWKEFKKFFPTSALYNEMWTDTGLFVRWDAGYIGLQRPKNTIMDMCEIIFEEIDQLNTGYLKIGENDLAKVTNAIAKKLSLTTHNQELLKILNLICLVSYLYNFRYYAYGNFYSKDSEVAKKRNGGMPVGHFYKDETINATNFGASDYRDMSKYQDTVHDKWYSYNWPYREDTNTNSAKFFEEIPNKYTLKKEHLNYLNLEELVSEEIANFKNFNFISDDGKNIYNFPTNDNYSFIIIRSMIDSGLLHIDTNNNNYLYITKEDGTKEYAKVATLLIDTIDDDYVVNKQTISDNHYIINNILELSNMYSKVFKLGTHISIAKQKAFRTIELMDFMFNMDYSVRGNYQRILKPKLYEEINKNITNYPEANVFWCSPLDELPVFLADKFIDYIESLQLKDESNIKDVIYETLSVYGNYITDGDVEIANYISESVYALDESISGLTQGLTDLTKQQVFLDSFNSLNETIATYIDTIDEGLDYAKMDKDYDNPKFDDFMLNNQMKIANLRNRMIKRFNKTKIESLEIRRVQLNRLDNSVNLYENDNSNYNDNIEYVKINNDAVVNQIDTIAQKAVNKMDVPMPFMALEWVGNMLLGVLENLTVGVFNTIAIVENMYNLMELSKSNFSYNKRAKLIYDTDTGQTYTLISSNINSIHVMPINGSSAYVDKDNTIPKYLTSTSIITKDTMIYSLIPISEKKFVSDVLKDNGYRPVEKMAKIIYGLDKVYTFYNIGAKEYFSMVGFINLQAIAAGAAAAASTPGLFARLIAAAVAMSVTTAINIAYLVKHGVELLIELGQGKTLISYQSMFGELTEDMKYNLDNTNSRLYVNDLNALSITTGSNAKIALKVVKELAATTMGLVASVIVGALVGKATKFFTGFKARWNNKKMINKQKKITVNGIEMDTNDLTDTQKSIIARNAGTDILTNDKNTILDNAIATAGKVTTGTLSAVTGLVGNLFDQKEKYKDILTQSHYDESYQTADEKLDSILSGLGSLAADGLILMLLRRINKKLGF